MESKIVAVPRAIGPSDCVFSFGSQRRGGRKFHVLQHAGRAIEEPPRAEFFRAGSVMGCYGRGKRWLHLEASKKKLAKLSFLEKRLRKRWWKRSGTGFRQWRARSPSWKRTCKLWADEPDNNGAVD